MKDNRVERSKPEEIQTAWTHLSVVYRMMEWENVVKKGCLDHPWPQDLEKDRRGKKSREWEREVMGKQGSGL